MPTSGDLCRPLPPHVDEEQMYLDFRTSLVPSLTAAAVNRLTESPLSTPVVQIRDVGEHVINPVLFQPPAALHYNTQIAYQ
jgi:hypothetical protein